MMNADLAQCGRYFPQDEYEERWARVESEMQRRGYEAAVVWGRSGGSFDRCGDVLWLSNFYSTATGHGIDTARENRAVSHFNARAHNAVILECGQMPELQADEDTPRPELMPIPTDRIEWHHDSVRGVADSLNRRKPSGRVALVGTDFLPMKYWHQLKSYTPAIDWVFDDTLILDVRRTKSPREQEAMREAGAIASRALDLLMKNLIRGRSEAEAAAAAQAEVARSGGRTMMSAVSHGPFIHYFAANPIAGYSQLAPGPGEIVRAWVYGPMFHGYFVDPGRTAVCGGKPSATQRELIETNARFVERLVAKVRPGVRVMDVALYGDALMKEFGSGTDQLSEKWPHYGHTNGMMIETPLFGKTLCDSEQVVEAGWVCGSEIFLSRPGLGSAGFEQNFIVHEDRNEIITPDPLLYWN